MHLLRKFFISGLLVWLPLVATFFVLNTLIKIVNHIVSFLPAEWRPEALLGFPVPGFGIAFSCVVLLLTGVIATNIFGHRLIGWWESLVGRIPMISTIYNTVKQALEIVFSSNNQAFRHVVLIEYPRKGLWCIGFQTNDAIDPHYLASITDLIAIFIPTVPNPTSGFVILVPRKDIKILNMSVEEAFKLLLSLGVVSPQPVTKDFFPETR